MKTLYKFFDLFSKEAVSEVLTMVGSFVWTTFGPVVIWNGIEKFMDFLRSGDQHAAQIFSDVNYAINLLDLDVTADLAYRLHDAGLLPDKILVYVALLSEISEGHILTLSDAELSVYREDGLIYDDPGFYADSDYVYRNALSLAVAEWANRMR
jgi:hypothetical protein